MPSPRLAVAVALLCAACRTPPAPQPTPEPPKPRLAEPGKETDLSILGATFRLPARLTIDDYRDDPGSFFMNFQDRVTRCVGFLLFESVSQPQAHEDFVLEKGTALRAEWDANGVQVTHHVGSVQLLGQPARTLVFDVASSEASARAALFDRHFASENLSLVGYVFCDDPGLYASQMTAIAAFVNSRK